MLEHNNTDFLKMQEEQVSKELDCKFSRHKKDSFILSDSYSRLGYDSRAIRVAECGSFLEFALFPEQDTKAKTYQDRVIVLLERILKKLDGFDCLCEPDMDDEP